VGDLLCLLMVTMTCVLQGDASRDSGFDASNQAKDADGVQARQLVAACKARNRLLGRLHVLVQTRDLELTRTQVYFLQQSQ